MTIAPAPTGILPSTNAASRPAYDSASEQKYKGGCYRTPPEEKLGSSKMPFAQCLPYFWKFAEFRLFGIFVGSFTFLVKWLKSRSILDCDRQNENSNQENVQNVPSRIPHSGIKTDA